MDEAEEPIFTPAVRVALTVAVGLPLCWLSAWLSLASWQRTALQDLAVVALLLTLLGGITALLTRRLWWVPQALAAVCVAVVGVLS